MTEQNAKIDGRTRRAADIALAKRTISRASYDALLAGRIGLDKAKAIGRDGAPGTDTSQGRSGPGTAGRAGEDSPDMPPRPVSRISKDDRLSPCLCGCGKLVQKRFAAGHDMAMFRVAREHLTEGRELNGEQQEYLASSGKMGRVRARLAREDARRREAETRKTTRKVGR